MNNNAEITQLRFTIGSLEWFMSFIIAGNNHSIKIDADQAEGIINSVMNSTKYTINTNIQPKLGFIFYEVINQTAL